MGEKRRGSYRAPVNRRRVPVPQSHLCGRTFSSFSSFIGRNQLKELPATIGRSLAVLTTLDVNGNKLKELPATIGSLAALTSPRLPFTLGPGGETVRDFVGAQYRWVDAEGEVVRCPALVTHA